MTTLETNLLLFQDLILTQMIDPGDFYCITLHSDIRCQGNYKNFVVKKYQEKGYQLLALEDGFLRLELNGVILVFS